jgi:anthranilate phosphoribosyltransferase
MSQLLERILEPSSLDESEASALFSVLADPRTPPALAGAYLAALRVKGESAAEVLGLVRAMRARATPCHLGSSAPLVDVVGTGGDHAGSFNLSTGSALLSAAVGAKVAKHGSGAVSSRSGAADVLAALGLPMPRDAAAARGLFLATGFTFLHAPAYHPALAGIGPVRRALGTRTVFNILGPLCNPASPRFAVIGASSPAVARVIAEAASSLPFERVFVVHGAASWDEPTPIGRFQLFDVRPGIVRVHTRDPLAVGLPRCAPSDLRGGEAAVNARAMRAALSGERGAHRDALVLGAALALEVAGLSPDPRSAAAEAAAAIDDGRAERLVARLAAWTPNGRNDHA